MAKPSFPQFQNGAKALARSAARLEKSAKGATYDQAALGKQRLAIERSRKLLSSLGNPRELGGVVVPKAAKQKPKARGKGPARTKRPRAP